MHLNNNVVIFSHQQRRKRLENAQDFFVKTKIKTKTCVFVLEALRDQDLHHWLNLYWIKGALLFVLVSGYVCYRLSCILSFRVHVKPCYRIVSLSALWNLLRRQRILLLLIHVLSCWWCWCESPMHTTAWTCCSCISVIGVVIHYTLLLFVRKLWLKYVPGACTRLSIWKYLKVFKYSGQYLGI